MKIKSVFYLNIKQTVHEANWGCGIGINYLAHQTTDLSVLDAY